MVLFQDFKRDKNINNKFKPLGIYPIKPAAELLSLQENQVFFKNIEQLIRPTQQFDTLYLPLIEKFAEFVQALPENQRCFFGQPTDFLSHGLERVSRVLSLYLTYFFPNQADFSRISKYNALWLYATFTAALLMDLGKIAVKYTIMFYHEKGYPLKKWDPYSGAMLGQGSYYKFDYIKENFDTLLHFITPVLARQILDSVKSSAVGGFNWIAKDPEVLETWFALLAGEEARIPMTSFMSMIPQAKIQIIENYRKKSEVSYIDPAGEAFLEWLRKQIKEEKITVSETSDVLCIKEKEIILSSALFQQFADANPIYKNPGAIERQFIDIAQVYQIAISELDQRNRALGGISGISSFAERYRTAGGIAAIQDNEKKSQRFLKGGIGLLALVTALPRLNEKNTITSFISPNPIH